MRDNQTSLELMNFLYDRCLEMEHCVDVIEKGIREILDRHPKEGDEKSKEYYIQLCKEYDGFLCGLYDGTDDDVRERIENWWNVIGAIMERHKTKKDSLKEEDETFELPENWSALKLEIYYSDHGKEYQDCYYEAPEKLEQRDVTFLLACFLKYFIKEEDGDEE